MIVKSLKAIQDLLGDLNDLNNLTSTVGRAVEESSRDRARRVRRVRESATRTGGSLAEELAADHEPGLIAMLRRIQSDRMALFEELLSEWLISGGRLDVLEADLRALFACMRQEVGYEIERKFLLLGRPAVCEECASVAMSQGYLPGDRLVERVRKKTSGEHSKYVRTIKLGVGVKRIEIEEECSAELFEALFALTEGRRVHKRRYDVVEGSLTWEIDEFLDRELFLAEVELPSEHTAVTIPDWLTPYLVREVTGEAAYSNVNLAM